MAHASEMSVQAQEREARRLEALSRTRRLSPTESTALADLLERQSERERKRRRRVHAALEAACLRVAHLTRQAQDHGLAA